MFVVAQHLDALPYGHALFQVLSLDVGYTGGFGWAAGEFVAFFEGGLVKTGFTELAKRWKPILDYADESGVKISSIRYNSPASSKPNSNFVSARIKLAALARPAPIL